MKLMILWRYISDYLCTIAEHVDQLDCKVDSTKIWDVVGFAIFIVDYIKKIWRKLNVLVMLIPSLKIRRKLNQNFPSKHLSEE